MSDKQLPDGIEWPRFEDNEPVKPGDVMYARDFAASEEIDCIFFEENGTTVKTTSGHYWWVKKNEKIKRPPVLDKDGQEIKVGDTVYNVVSGEGSEVEAIEWGRVGAVIRTTTSIHLGPSDLTHTPPDSWEKLREDTKKFFIDYWGCRDFSCDDCPSTIGEETPGAHYKCDCTKAQRLDVLARAEKLAGVLDDE